VATAAGLSYSAAMDSDRLRRAEAEAEAGLLRDEVARLAEERLRLLRKNEQLTRALHVLREGGLDQAMQELVEDALGYDGREPELGEQAQPAEFDLFPDPKPT
jgi:hypothetical protein